MNPFRKAAKEIKDRQEYPGENADLIARIETEGKIANALVKQALASGYVVSVYDGEEWALKFSSDRAEILAAMFSTDMDMLALSEGPAGERSRVGTINFIYGNCGWDVISDYSSKDLDDFTAWMKPISDYADKLAG